MLKEKLFIASITFIFVAIIASVFIYKKAPVSVENGNKKVVTFWQAGSGPERVDAIKKLILKFEQENPDIEIRLKVIPWDQKPHEKIQIAIASKTEPDMASVGSPFDNVIADFNVLEPLDKYMNPDTLKDFFNVSHFSGGIASLPWFLDVRALIYRKDLLAKKGIPEPTKSWTWDEFLKYARMLTEDTDGDGNTDIYGYAASAHLAYQFITFVWQNGGELYSPDGKSSAIASNESKEAIRFFIDLMRKYKVSPVFTTEDLLIIRKMFAEGKVAMFMDCSDAANAFLNEPDLKDKIGVGLVPHQKRNAAYAGYEALVMFKRPQNKEATARFLKFLTRRDNMLFYDKATGFSPSKRSVAADPYFTQFPIAEGFIKQAEVGKYWEMPPFTPTPSDIIIRGIQAAIEGKTTVDEAVKSIESKMNANINSLY